MIKRLSILFIGMLLFSCSSSKKVTVKKPLYEILVTNDDGGANIKFYEILTEPKEIMMLLGDESLRKLIKKDDTLNSSFIILNSGPTKETYNRIKVEKVVETATEIQVFVKDTQKPTETDLADETIIYPYTIVKINSKKPIVIK